MPTKTLPNPTAHEITSILRNARLQKSVWGQKLLAAALQGRTNAQMVKQAGNWPTCACGKATALVPTWGSNGEPKDTELKQLGMNFSDQIMNAKFGSDSLRNKSLIDATNTLVNIERRSAAIQQEMVHDLSRSAKQIGMKLVPIKRAVKS